MSTRVPAAPPPLRKVPRQARSRATVEVILEAGARVLGTHGWSGFSTNKVAALAGVSIGSFYQYFPEKASLLEAIRERHLAECLAVLRDLQTRKLTANQLVVHLVKGMIAVHDTFPGVHRVLLEEAPNQPAGRLDPKSPYELEYLGCYAAVVKRLRPHIELDRAGRIAVIVSDAIDGVIHNAARRGTLDQPELQAELEQLVLLYVVGEPTRIVS